MQFGVPTVQQSRRLDTTVRTYGSLLLPVMDVGERTDCRTL